MDSQSIKNGKLADDPEEFILLTHANMFEIIDKRKSYSGDVMDFDELAEEIMNHKKYNINIPIRILGCDAGRKTKDGIPNAAKSLADAIKRNGGENDVIASPEKTYATTPDIYKKQFKWWRFKGQ